MNNLLQPLQSLFPHEYHDRIFLVGGSVRDYLLQRPSEDYDLIAVVPALLLEQSGFRLVTGKTTAPIWFQHHTKYGKIEVILLNDSTLLDTDLQRRDFTINAIAVSLSGQMYDPLNGSSDMHRRLLRACTDQSFQDDPLRLFRAFRFEADGWRMTPETEKLIQQQDWTARLATIPVERFSREMIKALGAVAPERFFEQMLTCNLGKHWLPELFRMPEIPAGPLEHHPEGDLLTHSIQVLQRTAALTVDPLARFCAFFHDIGKLSTDPALFPKHHGHEEAGFKTSSELCKRLCLPNNWSKALAWTSRLHTHLNKWDELRTSTRIKVAVQASKTGIAAILPLVSKADKPGNSIPEQWQQTLAVADMNTQALGVDSERLNRMQIEQRAGYILQKRVKMLRQVR